MRHRNTTSNLRHRFIRYGAALAWLIALLLATSQLLAQAPQQPQQERPPYTQGQPPELATSPLKPHPRAHGETRQGYPGGQGQATTRLPN